VPCNSKAFKIDTLRHFFCNKVLMPKPLRGSPALSAPVSQTNRMNAVIYFQGYPR
jgi:hypothetical protein